MLPAEALRTPPKIYSITEAVASYQDVYPKSQLVRVDPYKADANGIVCFQEFKSHSDQKAVSAEKHVKILRELMPRREELRFLDIGSGDGVLLVNIISNLHVNPAMTTIHVLERSSTMIDELKRNLLPLQWAGYKVKVIPEAWDAHKVKVGGYDWINVSHVYEIEKNEVDKMTIALKDEGLLTLTRKRRDDAFIFLENFEHFAHTVPKAEVVFDNFVGSFIPLQPKLIKATMEIAESNSTLNFPSDDPETIKRLVEFLLYTKWESLPPEIQMGIALYIDALENCFQLKEATMILIKNGRRSY